MARKKATTRGKRVDPELIVKEFKKMRTGTPDEKLTALGKYFKKDPNYISGS